MGALSSPQRGLVPYACAKHKSARKFISAAVASYSLTIMWRVNGIRDLELREQAVAFGFLAYYFAMVVFMSAALPSEPSEV